MPAEETNYRGKQILLGFMKDFNEGTSTLAKAIDISEIVENFDYNSVQQTKETTRTNNNGQGTKTITGKEMYEGTLTMDTARPIMATLMAAVIGRPSGFNFGTNSAAAWATSTAHLTGDIVSLSGGGYLVAQNAGTTGATEPTITTEEDYDDLSSLDGDIEWKYRTELYEGTGYKTSFCTEQMIIIERAGEGCGSSNNFDRIILGAELGYLTMGQTDGDVVSSQAIPFVARDERRSSKADFEDVTVTTTVAMREDYFQNNQCLIRVDGMKYGTLLNFNLTYTRNTTARDRAGELTEKTVSVDAPTFTGDVSLKFDPAEYEELKPTKTYSVTIELNALDGEKVTTTIPSCQFHTPAVDREGSREWWLTAQLKPTGNLDNAMASIDVSTALNFNA